METHDWFGIAWSTDDLDEVDTEPGSRSADERPVSDSPDSSSLLDALRWIIDPHVGVYVAIVFEPAWEPRTMSRPARLV